MPFVKGKPKTGGRAKGTLNKATCELKELAQSYAPQCLDELVRLAKAAESEAARVSAIKEIFDRGYGKARQPLDHAGADGAGPVEIAFTFRLDSASSDDED